MFSLSHSPMMALFSANYIRSLEAQAEANGKVLGARHEGPVLAKARSLNALAAVNPPTPFLRGTSSNIQRAQNGGIKISYHDYRTGMLDYLRELGFSGLADFINSTISRSKTGSV